MQTTGRVAATHRLRSEDLFDDDALPGSFHIKEEATHFHCICPCGCGGHMNLPIYREGTPKPAPNAWKWDGDRESPTLDPSIRDLSGCRYHGHLRAGWWSFESDSGVKKEVGD
jgi:hypothetical protein